MVKINKVAAMLALGAATLGCTASLAFAAIPSPTKSSVVEGQTQATVTVAKADGTVVEQEFKGEITATFTPVFETLGIDVNAIAAAKTPEEKAEVLKTLEGMETADVTGGVANAFSGIIITPAAERRKEVRPLLVPQATLDILDTMETAIEKTADNAQDYQTAMLDNIIASVTKGLTKEEAAEAEKAYTELFNDAIAAVDPDGTSVLLANPRLIIVSSDNKIETVEGEEAAIIKITGFEIAGTTKDSKVYLTLQYILDDGTQDVAVVVPEIEDKDAEKAEGEKAGDAPLTYSFGIPANVSYMVMTTFGQAPEETAANGAAAAPASK